MDFFKSEEIEKLEGQIKSEHIKYEEMAKDIINKTNDHVKKFNAYITTINSERYRVRDEIRILYNFLSKFNQDLEQLTPFDFDVEVFKDCSEVQIEEMIKTATNDKEVNIANAIFAGSLSGVGAGIWGLVAGGAGGAVAGAGGVAAGGAAFAGGAAVAAAGAGLLFPPAMLIAGIAMAPLGIWIKKLNGKKVVRELTERLGNKKLEYSKDLHARESFCKSCEEAVEIAKIYLASISCVKDAIRDNIIPELHVINCFFHADAMLEDILYKQKIQDVPPRRIKEYQETLYHKHFLFVQNSFDFYLLSCNFFVKTLLTDILYSKNIKKDFEELKKKFDDKLIDVKTNVMITKGA